MNAKLNIRKEYVKFLDIYRLRHGSGDWADIFIDIKSAGGGTVTITSSFGTWSCTLMHTGKSLKRFLIDSDICYLGNKFKADGYFDDSRSIKLMKSYVISQRKTENIDKDLARKLFNQIPEEGESSSEGEFIVNIYRNSDLMFFFDNNPPFVRIVSPSFQGFWNRLWIPLMSHIKTEPGLNQ